METFSALLAFSVGNSPVTGEFLAQRPVTRSFGVFFDLHLNKRLSKQSWGWWFQTPSRQLWHHCNGVGGCACVLYVCFCTINTFLNMAVMYWRKTTMNVVYHSISLLFDWHFQKSQHETNIKLEGQWLFYGISQYWSFEYKMVIWEENDMRRKMIGKTLAIIYMDNYKLYIYG